MFTRTLPHLCKRSVKHFHTSGNSLQKGENPIKRTLRVLGNDLSRGFTFKDDNPSELLPTKAFPKHVDILIVGGAAMGSSIAYWLKEKTGLKGLSIAVIEKDQTYKSCSTVLSMGGLRQQFSLPENIQMSLYGAEFFRTLKKRFGPEADVFFTPNGYLMLASENGAQQLLDNSKLQKELGAINRVMSKAELAQKFPWLNVSDIEVGCLGLEKEGWFDPWALLCLLKSSAMAMGTQYVTGEVIDFTFENRQDIIVQGVEEGAYEALNEAIVQLPGGEINSIQFAYCIIAAGADSGHIARLANIGTGTGILSVPLPVEKKKRFVFAVECQENGPGINTPMTIDYTGTYFRRDGLGGTYLCGLSPEKHEEPSTDDLEVDHQFFDDRVWPNMAQRVPAFNSLKVRNAWAGYYDFNSYDENGIIGPHSYYHNLYIATGFSGHGIQQAPAVGRAIAELIVDGDFQSIDLTRLGFDRLIVDKPMFEACIV